MSSSAPSARVNATRYVCERAAADRSLAGEDVVLWHVFGVTHLVRAEDYPVMPCERVDFALKAAGFFDA